jgi:hypothetical protein
MTFADQITLKALADPSARHQWTWGTHRRGLRRCGAIHKLLLKAGIEATRGRDNTYPPGVCFVTFPCADYRRATAIADACYVGESWWPTKGKGA